MHRVRSVVLGVGSVVLLGLGACGGSDATACGLVTGAEAEAILDTKVREPEPDDESLGPGSSCAWISRDSTRDPQAAVYGMFVSVRDDSAGRREFARREAESTDEFAVVPVSGLGDAAYFVEPTEPNGMSGVPSLPTLHVRSGDHVLLVGTFDRDDHPVTAADARRIERRAARAALARL